MFKYRWPLAFVACLIIALILSAFKYWQIQQAMAMAAAFPEPSYTVERWSVVKASHQPTRTVPGEVIARQSLQLRNELEGRITAIDLPPGGQVRQGQTLVQLDTSEEMARLRAAIARQTLAQLDLQRVNKLLDSKSVSREQVDKAQAEYDMAAADIVALEAAIAKKTLVAPFDARVGLHDWEVGDLLSPNTELTTLIGLSEETWVDFNLPINTQSENLNRVTVSSAALNSPVTGNIIAQDSRVSAASKTLRYRALVPSPNLPNGALVTVSVELAPITALQLPTLSVLHDALGDYVYRLIEEEGTWRARRQPVTVLHETEQWILVADDLSEGDLIAARGAFKLHQGAKVTFAPEDLANSESNTP